MRNQEYAHLHGGTEIGEKMEDLCLGHNIECSCRFVGN
jgi:hypothetical protein